MQSDKYAGAGGFYIIHHTNTHMHTHLHTERDSHIHAHTYTQAAASITVIVYMNCFCVRGYFMNFLKFVCSASMDTATKFIDIHLKSFQKVLTLNARIWNLADILADINWRTLIAGWTSSCGHLSLGEVVGLKYFEIEMSHNHCEWSLSGHSCVIVEQLHRLAAVSNLKQAI